MKKDKKEKDNNSKTKNIVIIILALLLVGVVSYLIYDKFANKDVVNPDKGTNTFVGYDNALNLEDTSKFKHTYEVRYEEGDNSAFCQYGDCGDLITTIKTEDENIDVLDIYNNKYLF